MTIDPQDEAHMRRAIALARPHLGLTAENPSVGCVIVRNGVVVGEGATGRGGRPHAEELALQAAGGRAHGAVAYVTLEPCGARSTGAASCAERLVAAGVVQVIVACGDPSPYADGRGLAHLRAAGLAVRLGCLADEARALYRDYVPPASPRPRN
ncbi:MAG: bifunctional diaminohydroxyphosphoribosylaminopyrimidine deaminase/5-amino-6-(5-phosphoribosylamino)uracil reductase RibD [Phenylobacterium sp.]|uniref:bifunctional diaminohydroxyphosphoribosylaminopyrimidine deaminase/5-amino-6-(5-phosphoribosylamino)uracil reductase RibD n=1 Tax=Phenylobacterium sp. TaxID=1871053 RepID=UPI0027202214|nr:bifunctional diaminohydroxyphosphoribosylaminopyrimidine deaminase/5-amino-6-(5-phosphoribosylamino)uracil reductase RibD [Phenylobacterium sp.]MDO8899837.1 bifunctional diaminohydroxyphosphoribosylaminopyrimidine deaminase/5-amino-6-(5-phosphoribosylamino)uracil reductase RibD [Phenylobacterium sp.]